MILAECQQHCSMVDSYVGLMTDMPHILFELSVEALTGLALYPLVRRLRARFRKAIHAELDAEHGVEHHN